MSKKRFQGVINVDIRDSKPDWTPFEQPTAPRGAPNVLFIVLDDVGFSAMSPYGGPIETPNIERISSAGVRYTQFHTTALCSPSRSCLLNGRNHTKNSMACITEAAIGFPNGTGVIPRENGLIPEVLLGAKYGRRLHFWNLHKRKHLQTIDFGDKSATTASRTVSHRYRAGKFTLKVVAVDKSGNVARKEVKLRIKK